MPQVKRTIGSLLHRHDKPLEAKQIWIKGCWKRVKWTNRCMHLVFVDSWIISGWLLEDLLQLWHQASWPTQLQPQLKLIRVTSAICWLQHQLPQATSKWLNSISNAISWSKFKLIHIFYGALLPESEITHATSLRHQLNRSRDPPPMLGWKYMSCSNSFSDLTPLPTFSCRQWTI